MKKTRIVIEVTETKTVVTAVGSSGATETLDITGADIEKDFTYLLRKLMEFKTTSVIVKALDLNTWEEVKTQ